MNDPAIWFKDLFVQAGFSYSLSSFLSTVALVLIVILLSWFSNFVAKVLILQIVPGLLNGQRIPGMTFSWNKKFLPGYLILHPHWLSGLWQPGLLKLIPPG
jgi:hypothetical protein